MRVASAHKTPSRLIELLNNYEKDPRPKVYITVAGRSNALSGFADASVSAPIICCPPVSSAFGGADLYSSIRMPSGVAPMLVLEPANAALAAAKILGLICPEIKEQINKLHIKNAQLLYVDDAELHTKSYSDRIANERLVTLEHTKVDVPNVKLSKTGKVRDQYLTNDGRVILITTDRVSAFDRVLTTIPFKGQVLNLTSAWWFEHTKDIIPNHMISIPSGNVLIAKKCTPFPIEFVIRGYLCGSTETSIWTNYNNGVRLYCGHKLPEGMVKNQKLWANICTPTTKDDLHDECLSVEEIISRGIMSKEDTETCVNTALKLFNFGQKVASEHGLILVDTKYEFGKDADGKITLIDEIHTPDSSRYWIASTYDERMREGKNPDNIDKEFIRLWFKDHCDPYKDEKLPEAPNDLRDELSRRYLQLYEMITGESFSFPDESIPANERINNALKSSL